MKLEVLADADAVAQQAAAFLALAIQAAVAQRGVCVVALSGGQTPWHMLHALAQKNLPWDKLQIVQVAERVAPLNDPDRNLTHLRESLLGHAPFAANRFTPCRSTTLTFQPPPYAMQEHFK